MVCFAYKIGELSQITLPSVFFHSVQNHQIWRYVFFTGRGRYEHLFLCVWYMCIYGIYGIMHFNFYFILLYFHFYLFFHCLNFFFFAMLYKSLMTILFYFLKKALRLSNVRDQPIKVAQDAKKRYLVEMDTVYANEPSFLSPLTIWRFRRSSMVVLIKHALWISK